ncbi:urease accessory protein UreD [Duganella sp. LX20W]|uniref:Urease accessory protein UreD n=1 Tax=Rugamonas brunnea TaxID=2758569 RepID=A0A7W2I9U5_9BURK|nr:urease accessory protein UreD [Rugamonas brunnea]MBA5635460.1 urease accessory protein UreD [Rugamonas brunnea]
MPDCIAPTGLAASQSAWQASLALGFADDAGTTRLIDNTHCGPLRVQKALYPEGGAVCHAIIVHPPGGVVGGDQLSITATVGGNAHALLTTPGAAKWYKANGKRSRQHLRLDVEQGASLEWLPQETIFFDQADVALDQTITLAADARYIGCDILCMGRRASGETYTTGRVAQRTQIHRDGTLIWWEQGALLGGRLDSPLTLNGHTVCATLIAVGPPLPASVLTELRADLADDPGFGVTQTRGLLVARHLGDDSEAARRVILAVWRRVRPHLLGREAVTPRIWQT